MLYVFTNKCLTISARQTKVDICAKSVDSDETDRNKPSDQDQHCLLFCFFLF